MILHCLFFGLDSDLMMQMEKTFLVQTLVPKQAGGKIDRSTCMYKNKDIIDVGPKLLNQTLTIL